MGTKISALPNRATVQDTDLLVVADSDEGTNYKTAVSEFISGKGIITADTIDDYNIVTSENNPLTGRSILTASGVEIPFSGAQQTKALLCLMDFYAARGRTFTFSGTAPNGFRTDVGVSGVTAYGHKVCRLQAIRAGSDVTSYVDILEQYINTYAPAPVRPGDNIVILLRVNSSYANSKIAVRFSSGATAPTTNYTEGKAWLNSIALSGETPPVVYPLVIPMSDYHSNSTTGDFGATPNSMRIYVESLTTDGTTDVDVLGVYQTREVPTVIWDFDDGGTTALTVVKPIFDTYGLIGNISMIGTLAGGVYGVFPVMNAAQCQELYAAGWGFTVHGESGQGGMSLAEVTADVAANKAFLVNNGLTGDEMHYVYPGGSVEFTDNASFGGLAANDMQTARITYGPQCSYSFQNWGTDDTLQFNPLRQPAFALQETATPATKLQSFEHEVANLARHGGCLIVYSHNCLDSANPDFLNSRDITPATLTEAARILGMYQDRGLIRVCRRSDWWPGVEKTRAQRIANSRVN